MDIMFEDFLAFSIKALPYFLIIWFVTKILRRLTIEKHIQALEKLSDDRKARIIRLYSNIISTNRIALWMTPIAFLLFLVAFVLLSMFPELDTAFPDRNIRQFLILSGNLLVIAFIHFLEDSSYRKKILKGIEK